MIIVWLALWFLAGLITGELPTDFAEDREWYVGLAAAFLWDLTHPLIRLRYEIPVQQNPQKEE